MKRSILIFLTILLITPCVFADEILLKNGKVVEGNIIKEDEEKHRVFIDVVLSGELVGAILDYNQSEIQSIKKDGKYANLQKHEVGASTKKPEEQKRVQRAKSPSDDINARIRTRTNAEAQKNQKAVAPAAPVKQNGDNQAIKPVETHNPPMSPIKSY